MNIFALKYWAEKVSLKKSAGQLERLSSLLAKSTIDLNPYQIQAVTYAFNSPLSRGCILADEVGLGKTIEAGIVLSQLWLEGKKRILLIVPASLRTQWKQELETHFSLKSTIVDTEFFEHQVNSGNPTPLTYEDIFIVSLPFVYRRIKLIKKQSWNLIVIDEAHRLRRVYRGKDASKMAFSLREAIKDKPKLLLTATPLQNNLLELFGLVSFIDDKLLGNLYHFKTRFIDKIMLNPSLQNEALKILRNIIAGESQDNFLPSGVITRTLRKQVKEYVSFTPRNTLTIDFIPTEKEQMLYEKVSAYLQRKDIAAIETTQRNLMILVYRKLLASSSFAIAPTLKKLYEGLENELKLKRDELPDNNDKKIDESEEELEAEELEKIESKTIKKRVSTDFTDEQLTDEINELKNYYELANSINHNKKADALINAIKKIFEIAQSKNWPEKAVIFTESTRTQKYLQNVFKNESIEYIPFSGNNNTPEAAKAYDKWSKEFPELALQLSKQIAIRQALVYEFQTNPDKKIFLTTEAGAEGLNLQFSNLVVNYDLPWNPQRIEQRIGRVHRYGQKYEVTVVNLLNTKNYADKRVLELLSEKLGLFNGVFGSSDEILGSIETGIDFEQKILSIYQNCKTPEEIDIAFKKLQETLGDYIDNNIKKVREVLIDKFDTSISTLFKKTHLELKEILTNYETFLLRFCQTYHENQMKKIDEGLYKININNKIQDYLFRKPKEEEEGKISRISINHPIIQELLNKASKITTNPIPTIEISTNNLGKLKEKYHKNQEGILYIFKLIISSIEEDEILAPMGFILEKEGYKTLDFETSKILAEAESKQTNEILNQSPLDQSVLFSHWNSWKKELVNKFFDRNEKLYTREMDRIYRYWDNYSLKVKDIIDKIKKEIDELQRKREATLDFQEKREIDQRVQKANIRLHQRMIELNKEEQESLEQKQKDMEILNEKLKIKIQEKLIAIAKFKLV